MQDNYSKKKNNMPMNDVKKEKKITNGIFGGFSYFFLMLSGIFVGY